MTSPHTITSWMGETICMNNELGLGVSKSSTLLVNHYSAKRGETFPLNVSEEFSADSPSEPIPPKPPPILVNTPQSWIITNDDPHTESDHEGISNSCKECDFKVRTSKRRQFLTNAIMRHKLNPIWGSTSKRSFQPYILVGMSVALSLFITII